MEQENIPLNLLSKIGKRGTIVVPAILRKQYSLNEGTAIIAQPHPEGVLLKPVKIEYKQKTTEDAWRNWFKVTSKMKLSPEEVSNLKGKGRK